ncbi:MAG: glucose 1-dehydrogenase [Thermodesulfobacteriota bacterium]
MNEANHKTALVTGGAQGIGRAIASRLLGDGFRVVILDSDAEACREVQAALGSLGSVVAVAGDVASEQDVAQAVATTIQRFHRLDLLVCNAGISGGTFGVPVTELSLAQWQRVLDVNLTGCFLCAKYGAPHLAANGGSIVTIASTRALQSEPNTEPYSATKGGIVALSHALAMSLGPRVRVNCISPGWIDTTGWQKQGSPPPWQLRPEDHEQHPAGRVGIPEDVAALVAFLASEEAGFITGQNFVVDGGMTRKMIYAE